MKDKILLIDDDVPLGDVLRLMLTRRGFEVKVAYDGLSGLQEAYAFDPDVILLDVMLPDVDGWEVCQRFRQMVDVPIIMLTALNSKENVVKGLDLGADDYVVKPVTVEELEARIRAVLRRVARSTPSRSFRPQKFRDGSLVIDFAKHEVTVDHKRVALTPTEFRLLTVLAHHKGQFLSHEYLLCEVWGSEYKHERALLHQYISYLRRKVEKKTSRPNLIYSKWGVGYRLG
jgi:two-component system response regulator VicR